jgi:predicted TIM-barrel fold metal-dependent hydrolase
LNDKAAAIRDKQPNKFGFFASLANILDTQAALDEIAYAFDTLGADGVCLFTRYGHGHTYLGHADLEPIWAELNRRKAVVFVHPTHSVDTTPINSKLPQPSVDYPHETTRTAMDMLSNSTLDKFGDVKVILSHAGGNLPYLISRIATPLEITAEPLAKAGSGMTHRQIMGGFRKFYYDLALSASPAVLKMLLELVPGDHILYGVRPPHSSHQFDELIMSRAIFPMPRLLHTLLSLSL